MADSPTSAGPMPKTLAEARTVIQNLRQQLSGSSPPPGGNQPIPPPLEDPHPVWPARELPLNPQTLKHKVLASLFQSRSTADLFKMIRKSNDGRVMAAIRKELKN